MKVLITGATGFVGGWLTKRLVKDGHQVSALVRKESDITEIENLNIQFLYGDVCDLPSFTKALIGQDALFHLAGVVGYSPDMHSLMERVNIGGTQNAILACKSIGIKRLFYMSSVVAIGAGISPQPLTEESPFNLDGRNFGYFDTKHRAEKLVLEACARGDVDAIIVNPSTIYGRTDAKKSSRKTQLMVAQGRFPFYTKGGVNVVHIDDLVEGIVLAWEKGTPGQRYILAGENLTIKELFAIIAHEAGVKPPAILLPTPLLYLIGWFGNILLLFGKKGPITLENAKIASLYHWFDSSKAQRDFGFKARPAREAIRESVLWMKEQGWLSGESSDS